MPGGDRTGPMGHGPLTGGGFGNCRTSFGQRFSRNGVGGRQRGFGRGHGWRNRFWATGLPGWQRVDRWEPSDRLPEATAEKLELQRASAELEAELHRLRKRIEELEDTRTT
ncbi:MAG: DUF5320 domain-containing protein [Acidobacteria bacterium]|nr:DUF5320 domain-containing protein [Acidobacteriota bacterium]